MNNSPIFLYPKKQRSKSETLKNNCHIAYNSRNNTFIFYIGINLFPNRAILNKFEAFFYTNSPNIWYIQESKKGYTAQKRRSYWEIPISNPFENRDFSLNKIETKIIMKNQFNCLSQSPELFKICINLDTFLSNKVSILEKHLI